MTAEAKKKAAEAKARADDAFRRKDFMTAVDAYTQVHILSVCYLCIIAAPLLLFVLIPLLQWLRIYIVLLVVLTPYLVNTCDIGQFFDTHSSLYN